MKRVLFSLVFASILLSFGLSNAMTVQTFVDPSYYWDGDKLKAGQAFVLEIQMDNPDADRTGLSLPLAFYMTGDASTWGTAALPNDFGVNGFELTSSWWLSWNAYWTRDAGAWDGVAADTINWTGAGSNGMLAGSPMLTRFEFPFTMPMLDTGEVALFCVDSCSVPDVSPGGKFDWLFEDPSPSFGGPFCFTVAKQPDPPPEFTNCPTLDISQDFDFPFSYDFDATDDVPVTEGGISFEMVSGPGDIDPITGVWTFAATCAGVGSHTVVVGASDNNNPVPTGNECSFTITVTNSGPAIGGDCGITLTVGTGGTKTAGFTATDPNAGDVLTFSLGGLPGVFVGVADIDPNTGAFEVTADGLCPTGTYTFTVNVTDCAGATASCEIFAEVISEVPFKIIIEKVEDQLQGHHGFVDVYVAEGSEVMLGFDFLIGYDPSVLAFVGAIEGATLVANQWEYFTYRYSYNGNCGNGCPTGLLRVVGIAEYNDGPNHPDLVVLPANAVLFTLDFLVSSDYNVGGMYAAVNFYWMDCGDNAVAYYYRALGMFDVYTGLSLGVFMYDGTVDGYEVTDENFGFPTYFGAQFECFQNPMPDKPKPMPFVYYYNGGIDIVFPGDIDDRGDVNMNGVPNEIGDAVMFTNYFIYGLVAFGNHIEGSKAATEINGDGIALTVADLVYLIRVIVGDAMPLPKENPNIRMNAVANGSSVTVDNEIGAAYFEFAGNVSVTLADGANGMELKTGMLDGNTVALVYSFEQGVTAAGEILSTNGELLSVEAADYNGIAYKTAILPANFGLTNYPNPFNPETVIELRMPVASDYTIDVYNVLGQRVANYSGNSEAGVVAVTFDGSLHGSGVYFYRAQAGSFSATEKMVMLK